MTLYPNQPKRWEVLAGPQGIKKGGDITFFYPSTEWDMAQGFDCSCGAKVSAETAAAQPATTTTTLGESSRLCVRMSCSVNLAQLV